MPSRDPRVRFGDIIDNIDRINRHLSGCDRKSFGEDELVLDAVERCFQRITEASIKLQPLASELLPSQDWSAMRAFGNLLRHDYDTVYPDELWEIVHENLPPLREDCEAALRQLDKSD